MSELTKYLELDERVSVLNNGLFTSSSKGDNQNFRVRDLVNRCKDNSANIEDISEEEINEYYK